MKESDDAAYVGFGHPDRERVEFVFPPGRPDSDGWLRPTVTVSSGPFSGSADVYCSVSDFAQLLPDLQRLYDTLRGTATFDTIEGQIGFALTGDGLGHIALRGFLDDRAGGSNRLSFHIAYDQTLLWHSIAEIRDFLDANS
jgi:hypothetical protein